MKEEGPRNIDQPKKRTGFFFFFFLALPYSFIKFSLMGGGGMEEEEGSRNIDQPKKRIGIFFFFFFFFFLLHLISSLNFL